LPLLWECTFPPIEFKGFLLTQWFPVRLRAACTRPLIGLYWPAVPGMGMKD